MSYGYFRKPDMPETAKIDKSKNQFDSFSDRGYVSTDEEGNPVVLDYDRLHRHSGVPQRPKDFDAEKYMSDKQKEQQFDVASVSAKPNPNIKPYDSYGTACNVTAQPSSTVPYNPFDRDATSSPLFDSSITVEGPKNVIHDSRTYPYANGDSVESYLDNLYREVSPTEQELVSGINSFLSKRLPKYKCLKIF